VFNTERDQQGFRGSFDSKIKDPDWEVMQPLGEKGLCAKWYQRKKFFLHTTRKGEETKELEVVLCV
jgi:hypothetical protein